MILLNFKNTLQLLNEEKFLEDQCGSRKIRAKAVATLSQVNWLELELVCGSGMSERHSCLGYAVNQEPMRFDNELIIELDR